MTDFFDECHRLVNLDRQEDYGDPVGNFEQIAFITSIILDKHISARDVALFFIVVKLVREARNHKRDNLLDLACYAEILDRIEEGL
jgi:hypothetical protein